MALESTASAIFDVACRSHGLFTERVFTRSQSPQNNISYAGMPTDQAKRAKQKRAATKQERTTSKVSSWHSDYLLPTYPNSRARQAPVPEKQRGTALRTATLVCICAPSP